MTVIVLTVQQLKQSIDKLKKLATEIEETAIGSSRVEMYRAIASELRREAQVLQQTIRGN